jgi:phage/plasmid-like protein (TIGR03299 family)
MSKESSKWLNNYTLIGQTDKRGEAWHYRADEQGSESNHYPGFVPADDVERRLFFWEPVETALRANAEILTPLGVTLIDIVDNTRKVIIRPDTETVLGVFRESYQVHSFKDKLLRLTSEALGDGVGIGSAGLLSGGAVAWVQFEFDENDSHGGFDFRPFITASTSLDGSLASDWSNGVQAVVCDNTLSASLAENALRFKKRHTRNSIDENTAEEIRTALQVGLISVTDAFHKQAEILMNEPVGDGLWTKFIDEHFGAVAVEEGRSRTMALKRNDALNALWFKDQRVSPWKGTAFGVVQAVNTFTHHVITPKGGKRPDTNMLRAVSGDINTVDLSTVESLNKVLKANKRKTLVLA